MGAPANLKINIIANTKKLSKGLKNASKEVKGFSKGLKIGLASLGAAAVAAFGFFVDSVKKAIAEQKSVENLDAAVRRLADGYSYNTGAIEAWIDRIKYSSTFSDDQLRPSLARLIDATGNLKTAQDLLITSANLAVAANVPLETVVKAVTKAQEGNKTSLLKLFPELIKVNDKTKTGADLVQILANKYKDADKNASNTASGGLKKLGDTFDDIQETIGAVLLPYLEDFSKWLQSPEGQKAIKDWTGYAEAFGNVVVDTAQGVDSLVKNLKKLDDKLRNPSPLLKAFINALGASAPGQLGLAFLSAVNASAVSTPGRPGVGAPGTVINIQTLDPAAAGIAVRRALAGDQLRRGTLWVGS